MGEGSKGAKGLRAILKDEGGKEVEGEGREVFRDGGVGIDGQVLSRGKSGKGRSSRLNTRRRGWSEEGKAYRPSSEMTRRSKERKGRGGQGDGPGRGDGQGSGDGQGNGGRRAGAGGGGGSQSLSGSRSSLGRGETNSSMGGNLL